VGTVGTVVSPAFLPLSLSSPHILTPFLRKATVPTVPTVRHQPKPAPQRHSARGRWGRSDGLTVPTVRHPGLATTDATSYSN